MEFEEVYSVVGNICTRFGTKQLKPIPIWGDTYLYEKGGGGGHIPANYQVWSTGSISESEAHPGDMVVRSL